MFCLQLRALVHRLISRRHTIIAGLDILGRPKGENRIAHGLNGAKISKILGSLLPGRGYRILAQGFNPGNRPPGRRALKGGQVIVISNRLEKHISIGPRHRSICAGAHY